MSTSPIRALILADDCNPEWPSLPVVGYKSALALSREADVTLITHLRNRENIEKAAPEGLRVRYVDNEYIASPLYKLGTVLRGGSAVGWTTNIALSYPSYLAFEWEAWKLCRDEIRAGKFDVIHRITPMTPTLPSYMATRSKVPFVLGPLNGGLKWPKEYSTERAKEKEWLVRFRHMHRHLPGWRATYKNSAAILTAFAHTKSDLPSECHDRCINVPEVGIDPELFYQGADRPDSPRLRFLFAGRLVPYKLPEVLIECFARSEVLKKHELVIVGAGPLEEPIRQAVAKAGLEDSVSMLGWKSQEEVGKLMRECDAFVFPSIRELGAGVIAEAMASGMCCIAVDYGGPGGLLGADRGIKVPVTSREGITQHFIEAMESLVRDPKIAKRCGQNARAFALEELTWAVKAKRIDEVYRWVCGRQEEQPQPYPDCL